MNANSSGSTGPFGNPWLQLTIGVICMACVANLQYGWTLFVNPIDEKFHWGRAAIQVAFTVFVLVETWLIPSRDTSSTVRASLGRHGRCVPRSHRLGHQLIRQLVASPVRAAAIAVSEQGVCTALVLEMP